jgi:hypothetical protein
MDGINHKLQETVGIVGGIRFAHWTLEFAHWTGKFAH